MYMYFLWLIFISVFTFDKKNMTTELKQGSTTHYCRVISLKKDINSRESYFFKLSMSMLLSLSFSVFHKFDTNWCDDQFEASASLTGKTPRMDDVQMPVGCLTLNARGLTWGASSIKLIDTLVTKMQIYLVFFQHLQCCCHIGEFMDAHSAFLSFLSKKRANFLTLSLTFFLVVEKQVWQLL